MKHYLTIILFMFFLIGCTGQRARMEQVIREAKEQNLNYVPFTTDSLLRQAVAYYDRHGTANERLLAHYLLGCAYRDMNEAPLAIITWEDAVACADTTASDCDYATLFRVYGQMAETYYRQYMPEKELDTRNNYCKYALLSSDTTNYIKGLLQRNSAYLALGDTAAVYRSIDLVRHLYLERGMKAEAARVFPDAIQIALDHQQFERADSMMQVFEGESGLFDRDGNIEPTRERYYYDKGRYYAGIGELDSAEYEFRRLLAYDAVAIDGYHALLAIFQHRACTDSIIKYTYLYEQALADYLNKTQIESVVQAKGMYDYHRNERIAKEERQRAKRVKSILSGVIIIVSCAALTIYVFYNRKRKRERHKLLVLNDALHQAKDNLAKAYEELSYLRQNLPEREQTDALLQEKEKKILALEAEIEDYQSQLGYMDQKRDEEELMNTAIVMLLKDISHPRTVKDAQGHIQVIQPRACTDDEWKDLLTVIQQYHHNLYAYIADKHHLPKQQFKVCILSRLRFETQEMSTLLDTSPQTISNTRNKIAKRLFDLNDLALLNDRLAAL